jgi:hypothetical protein
MVSSNAVSSKVATRIGFHSALVPRIALFIVIAVISVGTALAATTHYIAANGSDSNNGTSKSTPWAHAPGMQSCTGSCASYSPSAGDTFVLRGCDIWVTSDLPLLWNWSGSSASPITIGGEDKTWFNTTSCPLGWNRPVFDDQNIAPSSWNSMFELAPSSTTSYVTADNIEFKRMGGPGNGTGNVNMLGCYNTCNFITISNNYFHAWDMTSDNCSIMQLGANDQGVVITQNVIDGSDRTGASGGTCYGIYTTLPATMSNNVIHDVPNAIVGYQSGGDSASTISGNLIYNILPSNGGVNHANAMEIVGGGTYRIHDNIVHDITEAGAESLMLGNSGETSYVWNNLFYNISGAQAPSFPQTSGAGSIPGLYFWNNTIVTGNASACFYFSGQTGATFGNITVQNNHCITSGGSVYGSGGSVATLVNTSNILETPTAASSNSSPHFDNYTASQRNVYSPIAATNSTVGQGTNLTSSCAGGNAGLCSDTAYACTQQSINGVVQAVCPARSPLVRPTSGAWDAGAYFYGVESSLPNAPTGLTAAIN